MKRSDLDQGIIKFKVAGEIQAGKSDNADFGNGEAFRIFTGAVIPEKADIVIIQEMTDRGSEEVEVNKYSESDKSNIREIGEQIRKGDVALNTGHIINPASIGLLASFGIKEVAVFGLPVVGIITTGNELKKMDDDIELGEIYESNSFSLKAALIQNGFLNCLEITVGDEPVDTIRKIGEMLEKCHVLILSGGISVGKYDLVKEGLEKNNVDEVFYKINQKPGKPMYFGVKEEKLVFALPGNPASLLVCFYEYVLPSLKKLIGKGNINSSLNKKLKQEINYKGMRPEFMRGKYNGDEVEILHGQSSFMLKSFAEANCLVYIHGEKRVLQKGDMVEVHPIF